MRVRLPDPLKTPSLLVGLLALQFLLPSVVESIRLPLLRAVAAPISGSSASSAETGPAPWSLPTTREPTPWPSLTAGPLMPVFDYDPRRGWLILGGGATCGVTVGARVLTPSGCLGVVDKVTTHLARVRLLSAEGVQVPVELSRTAVRRELPGHVERLVGVLRGDGAGVALVTTAHLPRAFRVGDELRTLRFQEDSPAWPVGEVVGEGLRPSVRLLARPDGLTAVRVEGAVGDVGPMFEEHPFELVLAGAGRLRGALISGAALDDVVPGCAVHGGGRYLGRVLSVTFGGAMVAGVTDPGVAVSVTLVGRGGGEARGRLVGLGRGRLRLLELAEPLPDGPLMALTAGGQELVPAGLLVASGEVRDGVIPAAAQGWPQEVNVSAFRWTAERRRLMGARR